MPAALGWHPWFRREAPGPRLRVDADEVLQTRAMIPTGRRVPVRGMTDLRPGNPIAGRHVDHAYVGPALAGASRRSPTSSCGSPGTCR